MCEEENERQIELSGRQADHLSPVEHILDAQERGQG